MTRSAKSQLLAAALFLLANASPGASTRGKKNLRRESSSAASSSNHDDGAHDEGFEVVGGPQESRHDVSVSLERSMLVERGGEGERLTSPESKEYIGSDSLAYVDPYDHHRRRHLRRNCNSDEKLWEFDFSTDRYGYETSWSLEIKDKTSGRWSTLSSGPPGNNKYYDTTRYKGSKCLKGDNFYRLTILDLYNDGFCCNYGEGTYSYTVGGIVQYDSNKQRTFTDKAVHQFFVGLPQEPVNEGEDDSDSPFSGRASVCGQNKQELVIDIKTDKYGAENTWRLERVNPSSNLVVGNPIRQRPLNTYSEDNTSETVSVCLPYGKYRFTMTDGVGDGICCKDGNGHYHLFLDDVQIIYGSDFNIGRSQSHDIVVGYQQNELEMTQREREYLDAHNWRREKFHKQFNSEYVPLIYDNSLAEDATKWAEELLRDCGVQGIEHEPDIDQGENLAKNTGSGTWGQLYPVENIVRRWVEREETWPYPSNAHFTQALWRSARYLGCGEATLAMDNGGTCRIQVCRYSRAGNCNMGAYNSSQGDNWKVPMLMDHNPCGPVCPPGGCHS
mmetsp:Transcript_24906/g.59125  ORF Transcript_24906/g.59125 Transcript_24906/m.59125 type:complete len:558 (+) Transcript_24906:288-1961(+)